jgi:two-component system chemotaxis response regulator CheY
MKVLVVDDSRTSRFMMKKALESLPWEIEEACQGAEAYRVVQEHGNFDLLFVDWNMPVMNGLELVMKVRTDDVICQPKIVMVTTETELERVAEAIERGADEYVMKPFTSDMILGKLALLGFEVSEG